MNELYRIPFSSLGGIQEPGGSVPTEEKAIHSEVRLIKETQERQMHIANDFAILDEFLEVPSECSSHGLRFGDERIPDFLVVTRHRCQQTPREFSHVIPA